MPRQPEYVIMAFLELFLGIRRNTAADNFFTSLPLAQMLQAKKTILVGTLNRQQKGLPPSVHKTGVHASVQHHCDESLKKQHSPSTNANSNERLDPQPRASNSNTWQHPSESTREWHTRTYPSLQETEYFSSSNEHTCMKNTKPANSAYTILF